MDIQAQAPDDYSGSMFFRCPKSLPLMVKHAARQNMTSVSAYMRLAALEKMRADGCIPANSHGGGGE